MSEPRLILCGRVFTSVEKAGGYAAAAFFLARATLEDPEAKFLHASAADLAAVCRMAFPALAALLAAEGEIGDAFLTRKVEEMRSAALTEVTAALHREIAAACSPRQDF